MGATWSKRTRKGKESKLFEWRSIGLGYTGIQVLDNDITGPVLLTFVFPQL